MANARAVIDIDINTSPAAAGLRDLQAQINGFTSALNKANTEQGLAAKGITRQLSDLVNASRFFTAETVRMQTSAAQLDNTLKKGQVTMGQFFSARFRKDGLAAAQVMSLANARAAALQTQFIQTGAAAGGMREALAIRPLQAFNSATVVSAQKLAIHRAMLQQATTSMINFGKNTQWAGRQLMVGFTVPLTIFAGVAGKAFRDLEKEAVNFRKVYGDSFTPPEEMEANLKAVQELAKEYTKYGIAVKDTIGLAAEAAAAGAQNADLIDATRQATRLATLGQMEQNQALETTISLQNAFKLSGNDLAKSINFLNMVENQTVVTLQDLSAAIPRVAPVIKGLGGSVEDLAAMLAAMQEGGVSAEQGANALKSGLASLINPTDKAVEKLQGMGIALNTIISANRGDLMGTVQDFGKALQTLDAFTRQQALEQVFGKFQYARLGALFDNIVKEGSQASRVLEITAMSTAEMAASAEKELSAIEQSVGVKFTAAMEKLQLAIAPIGEMFTKMAIPVINFFVKIIEKFNELPDFAKNFIGLGTVITGIVIPAGTMFLGLLMNLIGTLVKFGSMIGIAFKGFMSGGIKGAFDAVSQAVRYMSLQEIDASLAAQQLAGSTQAVNTALLEQVGSSEAATAGVMSLAGAYEVLIANMREAVLIGGLPMAAPGAAMRVAGRRGASNLVGRPLPIVARNKGGSIPYLSDGGRPTVPGVGSRDTVPAMLTPGEFVVNKKATQNNLGLLNAINSGDVQYRNLGGGIARSGRMFYGVPPAGLSMAGQQALARLQSFEGSRGAIASMFGLPATAVGRSSGMAAIQRVTQAVIRGRVSEAEKVWQAMKKRTTKSGGKLKSVRLAEYLMGLPKNPLTVEELGLKSLGNYVLDMSQSSNIATQRGALTKTELLSELKNKSLVYRPIDEQLRSYFNKSLDYDLFDSIYRKKISSLPATGIGNKQFEKASRSALTQYLKEAGFTREQRKSFIRDILAKDLVRANVQRDRLVSLLKENNIPTRPGENRRDLYIDIDGETFNVGPLSGKKFGTLRTSEQRGSIRLYESLSKRSGKKFARVHANKGGIIPGMQYFSRGGVAQRLRQAVLGPKPIKNPYQQKAIEGQLANWLDMKMRKTNVRELATLLGTRQKETELFRGIKMRPSDSGFAPRFPKEVQDSLYRFARSGNPDDLAAIIGKPVAISPRSFSTSRKVAQTFGGDPVSVGNPQKDAAPLILKLRNKEGVFGFKPTQRVGESKQSGKFTKEKRFYGGRFSSQNEKEIVPVGDPRLSNRKDVVVGRWGFDGKDVFIDTGARLSKREVSRATQQLDAFTASRFTSTDEIRQTQLQLQRLQVDVERARKNQGRMSSRELGDLGSRLMAQIDRNKLLSGGTRQNKRAIERMTTRSSSMLEEVGAMFNRAKALGLNMGGFISPTLKMNNGNIVPGVGNRDTVPAMLTPGEFVVNQKATQDNLGLLHAINAGNVQGFREGGHVQVVSTGSNQNAQRTYVVRGGGGQIIGEFQTRKEAEKALREYRKQVATRAKAVKSGGKSPAMMRGMGASMGLGMGGMGIMMAGQKMEADAMQRGETSAMGGFLSNAGIALSMASVLPFLGKFGIAIAAATAVIAPIVLSIKAWRNSVDEASKKAAEFGANIGGTANALNTMASILGEQTPAQRQAQLKMGFGQAEQEKFVSEFAAVFETESGKKFIEDLENATSSDRFIKLSSYLQNAIAAGMMDKDQAQSFAKAIGSMLSDPTLGAKTSAAIRGQETGAQALTQIARQREEEVSASSAIAAAKRNETISYQESSQVIGSSLQVIQDYSNAQALAYEEFVSGSLTFEEYQTIIQESRDAQAEYTRAVKDAMQKTSDFGGSMQALKDQLIALGLTTSQYEDLESTLTSAAEQRASADAEAARNSDSFGAKLDNVLGWIGVAAGVTAPVAVGTPSMQDEKKMAERSVQEVAPAVAAAIAGGMSATIAADVGAQIIAGTGMVAETYASLVEDLGATAAFEGAALIQQVQTGQLETAVISEPNARGRGRQVAEQGRQRDITAKITAEFINKGGDPVAFQAWLESIPEEKRFKILTQFEGMSPEEEQRYIADAGVLAQSYGDEFAQRVQDSQAYIDALAGGETQQITDAVAAASEAGVDQIVLDYVIRTEGANDPEDFVAKTEEMTKAVQDITALPEEVVTGLNIDIKNAADLEKYGPMVDQLQGNMKIFESLDPRVDLVRSMKFLTLDKDGKALPPDKVAKNVEIVNKAWQDLSGKDKDKKLQAVRTLIMTTQDENGNTLDPDQVDAAYNELIDRFGKGKIIDLPPETINRLVQFQLEVEGLNEQISFAKQERAMIERFGGDTTDIDATITNLETMRDAAIAAQGAAVRSAPKPKSDGGGGGGQKSLGEQLSENVKIAKNIFKGLTSAIDDKGFKAFIAGPFAPEFLDYLRQQGEEGEKILKGGLSRIKKEYEKFQELRGLEIAQQAAVAPFARREENRRLAARGRFTQGLAGEGLTTAQIDYVNEAISDEEIARYNQLIALGKKRTDQQNEELKIIQRNINRAKKQSLTAVFQEQTQAFDESIRQSAESFSDFAGMINSGIDPAVASTLQDLGLSIDNVSQSAIDAVKNMKIAESLRATIDGLSAMNDELKANSLLSAAGYTGEFAEELKGLGINAYSTSEQIKATANGLLALKAIQTMTRTETEKLNISLENQNAVLQAQLEAYQRNNIQPLQDQLDAINDVIDAKQRDIEMAERRKEPYEKEIDAIEEQKDKLSEAHDERIKALEKVESINQRIAQQQKSQLDIASALSRGDIAGAAQAALQTQQEQARSRVEEARAAITQQYENEQLALDNQIKDKREEIKTIDEEINRIQGEIRDKQDDAFNKQKEINDAKKEEAKIQEKMYRLQLLQSMAQTQADIRRAAQAGDTETVGFLQQQLQSQLSIGGADQAAQEAFFSQVEGGRGVVQASYGEFMGKSPGDIVSQAMADIMPTIDGFRNIIMQGFSLEDATNPESSMPAALRQLVQSAYNTAEEFKNPATGLPYTVGEIVNVLGENGALGILQPFIQESFDGSIKDMGTMLQQVSEKMVGIGAITDQIVEGFRNIRRRINEKIESAQSAIAELHNKITEANNTKIQVVTEVRYVNAQQRMFGGNINYRGSTERAPGFMYGGKMKKFAYGSIVPGIGMTDRVPALLTPGEFVVRKSVAQEYGPLLSAINSNVFPKMNTSGAMPKSSSNTRDGIQYNYDIDVNVAGTNASPDEIAKAVMYRIKRIDDRQVRGTKLG